MALRRCPLCATVSEACGGHPSLDYKALDLMPLMNSQGAGMTSPQNSDTPVELKEYTYTRNGMEHTAQLSEEDAKALDATATGTTVEPARFNEKPPIAETTPGYGANAARFKPGGEKSETAPKNKAVKAPADK